MESTEANETKAEAVWGLAGTIIWGVVIGLIYIYALAFGMGIYIGAVNPGVDPADFDELFVQYEFHGIALSFGVFASAIVCLPLMLGAIKLKRQSNLGNYLGLKPVDIKTFGYWYLTLFLLGIAFDLLLWLVGRPIVPEFALDVYRSAAGSWILWLAIVLVAPLVEEVFFRGLLFAGLSASILGPVGAISITALIWAALHIQYDLFVIAFIFVVGVLLGLARYKTGSIVLTFSLHALMNLGAMILAAVTLTA